MLPNTLRLMPAKLFLPGLSHLSWPLPSLTYQLLPPSSYPPFQSLTPLSPNTWDPPSLKCHPSGWGDQETPGWPVSHLACVCPLQGPEVGVMLGALITVDN